uniref:Transmembrane protein 53 n=1 Tax=Bos taurus TaxID=9913 RepID=A0A452DIG8_BOVIN
MASAQLDYTIEIPDQPCRSQENSPDQGGKEAGTRLPLVILLGWGGCSDKNLAKYSAIYHKRGCIVIRYTAPWHMVFFSETLGIPSLRVLAQKLLELLFDYEVEKEPLLFHVFSNAGVMLYRYVLELLQTHQRFCHLRVVGTIFDSGPGDSNLLGALRALAVVLEHRPAALRLLLLVAFTLVAFLFHVLLAPLTALFHTHFYDRLLDAASRWPELYLYSRADEVVLARDVERMVEARLAHQVLVRSVDFVSSAHVSHLRDYPTYYTTLCINFMHSCVHCSGAPAGLPDGCIPVSEMLQIHHSSSPWLSLPCLSPSNLRKALTTTPSGTGLLHGLLFAALAVAGRWHLCRDREGTHTLARWAAQPFLHCLLLQVVSAHKPAHSYIMSSPQETPSLGLLSTCLPHLGRVGRGQTGLQGHPNPGPGHPVPHGPAWQVYPGESRLAKACQSHTAEPSANVLILAGRSLPAKTPGSCSN